MIEEKIAEGVISYLAGKEMAAIFDEGGPSIKDVKGWIDNAVVEIKKFVSDELHRQLTEQYQLELIVKVNATITDLTNYDITRPRQKQILDAQTTRIGELIEATRQMNFAGILIYVNLISMQLLIYFAYVKHHSKSGYLPLVDRTVKYASEHVEACIAENVLWNAEGITSVVVDPIFRPPYGNADWQGCIRFRGGSECLQNDGYQTIQTWQEQKRVARVAIFTEDQQRAITEVHVPLRNIVQTWIKGKSKAAG